MSSSSAAESKAAKNARLLRAMEEVGRTLGSMEMGETTVSMEYVA